MAVGTGAISLDEVRIEIGLGSTASLQDCVDNATGTFDPTYYTAPATSLAEFRGYSHVCVAGLVSFTVHPTLTTSALACSPVGGSTTHYHNGGANPAANGDTVYTDSGGCTVHGGTGSSWIRFNSGGASNYKCQINASGVIFNRTLC